MDIPDEMPEQRYFGQVTNRYFSQTKKQLILILSDSDDSGSISPHESDSETIDSDSVVESESSEDTDEKDTVKVDNKPVEIDLSKFNFVYSHSAHVKKYEG